MKRSLLTVTCRPLIAASASMLALTLSGALVAQTQMTADDLERLIAEQKAALEEAIANREAMAAKVQELQDALSGSSERREEVERELRELCEEQENLVPGTMSTCMKDSES